MRWIAVFLELLIDLGVLSLIETGVPEVIQVRLKTIFFKVISDLRKDANNQLSYHFAYRNRGDEIQGWQQRVDACTRNRWVDFKTQCFFTEK